MWATSASWGSIRRARSSTRSPWAAPAKRTRPWARCWAQPCRPTRWPTPSNRWSRSICASARAANGSSTPSGAPAAPPSRRPAMPTRIRLTPEGHMVPQEDPFTWVADDQDLVQGDLILSLTRFQAEGDRLLSEGRAVGVRLKSDEEVEALAYDLPRIAVVELEFPKFRAGRAYSNARILHERYDQSLIHI